MKPIILGMNRRGGKSVAQEIILAEYLKRNPNATIARFKGGEMIVEKAVHGERVEPLALPSPK